MKKVRKVIAVFASLVMAGAALLPCGCAKKQQLVIYNWGEYIADDTIAKFEAKFPQYEVVSRRTGSSLLTGQSFLLSSSTWIPCSVQLLTQITLRSQTRCWIMPYLICTAQ